MLVLNVNHLITCIMETVSCHVKIHYMEMIKNAKSVMKLVRLASAET